jgi:hypothetical protein
LPPTEANLRDDFMDLSAVEPAGAAKAGKAATATSKTVKTARIVGPYWCKFTGTLRKSQGKFV